MLSEMIPDWLVELIKNSKPISQEFYDSLISKNYTSGKPILIGDYVLFGILLKPIKIDSKGIISEVKIEVIKFKSSEIGTIYELDPKADPFSINASKLPRLKFIKDKINKDYLFEENKI